MEQIVEKNPSNIVIRVKSAKCAVKRLHKKAESEVNVY